MGEFVKAQGISPSLVVEIPNFCDDKSISPCAISQNGLRRDWKFAPDDFVVGYSGNLGRAHDLQTMLGAAEALKAYTDIKFLFVGGGYLRAEVEKETRSRQLTSIVLKPYQPREHLGISLSVPDVHWVALRPELEGLILPSKVYGIAAAGRPVLMIGDPRGEIGRIVSIYGFGSVVPIGAVETLAARILRWRNARAEVELLGSRARRFIDDHAARSYSIDRWELLVQELSSER
jgi:glycosyltransferase involved in cell wall biosynthesis